MAQADFVPSPNSRPDHRRAHRPSTNRRFYRPTLFHRWLRCPDIMGNDDAPYFVFGEKSGARSSRRISRATSSSSSA